MALVNLGAQPGYYPYAKTCNKKGCFELREITKDFNKETAFTYSGEGTLKRGEAKEGYYELRKRKRKKMLKRIFKSEKIKQDRLLIIYVDEDGMLKIIKI